MPFFRVDDGMAFHAKTIAAGNEAIGARDRAGAWSSAPANLTDGWIPRNVCLTIAPARVWARLRMAGLAEPGAGAHLGEDGEQLHGFLDYNPSASDVRAERNAWKERRAKARAARVPVGHTRDNGGTQASVPAVSSRCPPRPGPGPGPSPSPGPVPGEEIPEEIRNGAPPLPRVPPGSAGPPTGLPVRKRVAGPAKAARDAPLPEAWAPAPALVAYGLELGLDRSRVLLEVDAMRDWSINAGAKGRCLDWDARFRSWLRTEAKRNPGKMRGGQNPRLQSAEGLIPAQTHLLPDYPFGDLADAP